MGDYIKFCNILQLPEKYRQQLRTWRNEPFVRERMFNSEVISEENHNEFLRVLALNDTKKIFVCFLNNEVVGVVQLSINTDKVDFGYYVVNEKYLNSSFGVIMEYFSLEYSFNVLQLEEFICKTLLDNKKVWKLHTKFGFESEDKEITINESSYKIKYQWITKDNWPKHKESIKRLLEHVVDMKKVEFDVCISIYTNSNQK